jgi:hypothetical protein
MNMMVLLRTNFKIYGHKIGGIFKSYEDFKIINSPPFQDLFNFVNSLTIIHNFKITVIKNKDSRIISLHFN